jgi:hypothetical protein
MGNYLKNVLNKFRSAKFTPAEEMYARWSLKMCKQPRFFLLGGVDYMDQSIVHTIRF